MWAGSLEGLRSVLGGLCRGCEDAGRQHVLARGLGRASLAVLIPLPSPLSPCSPFLLQRPSSTFCWESLALRCCSGEMLEGSPSIIAQHVLKGESGAERETH